MKVFLTIYTAPLPNTPRSHTTNWNAASLQTTHVLGKGPWFACQLCVWTKAYFESRLLPQNRYGTWNKSRLEDEDLAGELHLHLQSLGKYVRALDIVHYLDRPEVQKRYGLKKTISLATAR